MRFGLPRYTTGAVIVALMLGILVPTGAYAFHHREPAQVLWEQAAATSTSPSPAAPVAAPAMTVPESTGGDDPVTPRTVDADAVQVDFEGDFFGWARLDRATGSIVGANLTGTNSTESMIKTWLVADYLRRSAEAGQTPAPDFLQKASDAIRHSDDNAAQALYIENGRDESVARLVTTCGLTETTPYEGWWSRTRMSPRDAVRLGECLANGTAAGASWTPWLLSEMRQVEGGTSDADQHAKTGGGRWGIIDGVPAETASELAIKNGWTAIKADGLWHVNCLAISEDWVMSVMLRYPTEKGLDYGAGVCANVARQLTLS